MKTVYIASNSRPLAQKAADGLQRAGLPVVSCWHFGHDPPAAAEADTAGQLTAASRRIGQLDRAEVVLLCRDPGTASPDAVEVYEAAAAIQMKKAIVVVAPFNVSAPRVETVADIAAAVKHISEM